MTSASQTTFPENKHIAFVQLSKPNQLFQDCWAEDNERILIVGIRKGDQPQPLRDAVLNAAVKRTCVEESCFGTSVANKVKAIVPNDPAKIRAVFDQWQKDGIITAKENERAVKELGIRTMRVHPLMSIESDIGAHI